MTRPGKSRKLAHDAPNHRKSDAVRATLSPELRERTGSRSVRVRKNDSVRVLRGEFKGVEGKVTKVSTDVSRITIEGVTREKIAGGTVPVKVHVSNVMVNNLNLDDKWRRRILEKTS
jgi:large subunit ribosomal protein L24